MSTFKASKLATNTGVIMGTPVNIQTFTVSGAAAQTGTGYQANLSNFTSSNTALIAQFTYQPVLKDSYIVWMATLDMDSSSSGNYEHLVIFVNGTPMSNSYFYKRNSGNEPRSASQSGVYTNSSGARVDFQLRAYSGGGWTQYLGVAVSGTQSLSNTITIFEVQK